MGQDVFLPFSFMKGTNTMKICKSCGKEYKGEYCEHCGYGNPDIKTKAAEKYKKIQKPLRHMTEEEKAEYLKEQKNKPQKLKNTAPKKAVKIIAGIVCVLVIAALVLFVLYKRGYIFNSEEKEDVAEKYFQSISDRDFEDFLSCVPPALKDAYEQSAKEMGLDSGEALDTLYSDYNETYGDDFKININLGKAKAVENDAIEDYENEYKELYDEKVTVSEAYVISATASIKGSISSKDVYYEIYTAKIGGKWYVVNVSDIIPTVTE